ncbi:MAG: TetR/AcrR family transcriptional regulator [Alphaproteobacteria bacterium]
MKSFSKKGEQTRQSILNAAMDLFHAKGFQGTSVDEILKTSGTGKSQFYHYFKSKEDLIHELLVQVHDHITQASQSDTHKIKSWTDLENWFMKQLAMQEQFGFTRGCPIATIGDEASEDDKILQQDIANIFEAVCMDPEQFFVMEKQSGRLIESANPKQLALYCLSSLQGGIVISKMKQSPEAIENAISHTMKFLLSNKK